MISCFFIGLPFLVDDACIIEGVNSCAQDTFFEPCSKPLILAAEMRKIIFLRSNFIRLLFTFFGHISIATGRMFRSCNSPRGIAAICLLLLL